MTQPVTIALVQQSVSSDRQHNVQLGLDAVRESARRGANIVCFAELAFELFYPQYPASEGFENQGEPIPGPITQAFAELAKELEVVIVLNLFERQPCESTGQPPRTFDSSPVIDADGTLLGVTRMVHITDYECFHEKGYYVPGDSGAPVYATRFGNLGVAICYDRHYPEYMRAMAVGGADVVVVPQAGAEDEWPDGLYEAEMRVASFQNGYFAALCNRVGAEDRLTFAGESFVCDPWGKVVGRAGRGTDEILIVKLDISRLSECPARKLFLPDRRPELYARWLSD